jgi:glyoxylase-like metal-dependent hydrolase (beta-lactamase superfamily II)
VLGDRSAAIQECIFFDTRIDGFRYTVVDIWTAADALARDLIYSKSEDFVAQTGWYPRAHGEKLSPTQSRRFAHPNSLDLPLGSLQTVESAIADGAQGGVALRLRTTVGSILLDAGMPSHLELEPSDVVVLLTHRHLDHSGGVESILKAGVPVAMSAVTEQLLRQHRILRQRDRGVHILSAGDWYDLGGSMRVRPFPVPHMPGSVGYQVSDGQRLVIYTGDICLRTKRHDFVDDLVNLAAVPGHASTTIILDGTMIRRDAGASHEDAARAIFEASTKTDDLVLIADHDEQALYCYLDLFYTQSRDRSLRGTRAFICPPGIRGLMEDLLGLSTRTRASLDPFLAKQYGGNALRDLWGESTLLYWSDTMISQPDSTRIWITSRESSLSEIAPGNSAALATIGRGGPTNIRRLDGLPRLDLDTSPWTVHSDRTAILDAVSRLTPATQVLVFHAPKGNVTKAMRDAGLDATGVSSSAVPLTSMGTLRQQETP